MSEPIPVPANTPQDEPLTQRYADQIGGPLGCWERGIITGTLPGARRARAKRLRGSRRQMT